jgi:hypothetical protein
VLDKRDKREVTEARGCTDRRKVSPETCGVGGGCQRGAMYGQMDADWVAVERWGGCRRPQLLWGRAYVARVGGTRRHDARPGGGRDTGRDEGDGGMKMEEKGKGRKAAAYHERPRARKHARRTRAHSP